MAKGYYDEYEQKLLEGESDTKYEEDPRTTKDPDTDIYYPLPAAIKSRSLKWAVIALVSGILSLVCCPVYVLGFVMVLITGASVAISRRNLGYFDKYSTFGLIFGIVGFVCNVFSLVVQLLELF